jgi:Rod binding domain-containing protein
MPTIDTITAFGTQPKAKGQATGLSNLNLKPSTPNPELREAAGKTVGSAFYGTIFQMMRESPFKTEIGSGGRGEEVFSAQLHGVLAERLGESKQCNLSDVLYRRLEKQQRLVDEAAGQRNRE